MSDQIKVTIRGPRNHPSLEQLNDSTEVVRINQLPFFWLIKEIVRRAPHVKIVEIAPSQKRDLHPKAREQLTKAGIQLRIERSMQGGRRQGEVRHSAEYLAEKKFIETINGEAKERLEELLRIGWKPAEMMLKYYGVGYPQQTQTALNVEYGYHYDCHGSRNMRAVLYYLNPSFRLPKNGLPTVRNIERQVKLFYEGSKINSEHDALTTALHSLHPDGVSVPSKIPDSKLEDVQTLQQAKQDGRLECLKITHPHYYTAVALRFGFLGGTSKPVYHTLDVVGEKIGVSSERARQIIELAFKKLKNDLTEIDAENIKTVRTLTKIVARHWQLPDDFLTNKYSELWAYHVVLYFLHTFYGWPFEKIRQAAQLSKVTTVQKSCERVAARDRSAERPHLKNKRCLSEIRAELTKAQTEKTD